MSTLDSASNQAKMMPSSSPGKERLYRMQSAKSARSKAHPDANLARLAETLSPGVATLLYSLSMIDDSPVPAS